MVEAASENAAAINAGSVTVEEVRELLARIREQAADARVFAKHQAETILGVVDVIARQWEDLAADMETRLGQHWAGRDGANHCEEG